jgi:hypothetical protein
MFRIGSTLLLLTLACCSSEPQSRASQAQQAACRQRADEIYTSQNRGQLWADDHYASSTRDTPFSADPMRNTSSGLSGEYARRNLLANCLNGTGTPPVPTTPVTTPTKP